VVRGLAYGWMNGWMDGFDGLLEAIFCFLFGGRNDGRFKPRAIYIYVLMMKLHVKSLKSTALL
jgi:DNA-binding transcriptional regulator of glucitol operon